jgi:hypothetical protein
MARKTEKKTPTKYVKATCAVCQKKVDQYLTITPGEAPLKLGAKLAPVGKWPAIVCKDDLEKLHA